MDILDDDDSVIVPAPSPQALLPGTARRWTQDRNALRSLFFRRTMIPILLTCGLMLPSLGILWFMADVDSVVRRSGLWLPLTLIAMGAILLLLGVINMAQVRHLMDESRRARSR